MTVETGMLQEVHDSRDWNAAEVTWQQRLECCRSYMTVETWMLQELHNSRDWNAAGVT